MIDNYRYTGLIPPRANATGDGTQEKTTSEIIQEEMSANDPVNLARKDVTHYMDAGVDPEVIVSLIMIRNAGLRQSDAVRIVNEIAGTKIDSAKFVFKIAASDMEIGDAPITERKDPRTERLLTGRRDAERYIASEMSLSEVLQGITLRNGLTRDEAQTIIDDLTGKP